MSLFDWKPKAKPTFPTFDFLLGTREHYAPMAVTNGTRYRVENCRLPVPVVGDTFRARGEEYETLWVRVDFDKNLVDIQAVAKHRNLFGPAPI